MDILLWIVFGLVVGLVAKLIMPGRDPGGILQDPADEEHRGRASRARARGRPPDLLIDNDCR